LTAFIPLRKPDGRKRKKREEEKLRQEHAGSKKKRKAKFSGCPVKEKEETVLVPLRKTTPWERAAAPSSTWERKKRNCPTPSPNPY